VIASKIEQNTDADPKSLALPESLWCSNPTRSMAASMAELISSTTITNIQLPMKSALLTPVSPKQIPTGITNKRTSNSC